MKKVFSFYDSRSRLFVDCTECTRGRNGTDQNKCSCGWKTKKPGVGQCGLGTLIPGIVVPPAEVAS